MGSQSRNRCGYIYWVAFRLKQEQFFVNFHGKTKLLIIVLGPVSVEAAASARFASYERKIIILTPVTAKLCPLDKKIA